MQTHYFDFHEVQPGTAAYDDYLALRYDVFFAELHRVFLPEVAEGAPRRETDRFDPYSRHLLAVHRATGTPAGCVRLILPNLLGLNVHARYVLEENPYPEADPARIGEISRMAVSSRYRRREEDAGKPVAGDPTREIPDGPSRDGERRRRQPELVLGMYREIVLLADRLGLTHAYAAMDATFSRLLLRIGLPFVPVGPVNPKVEPPRRPFIISRAALERELARRNPQVLRFLKGESEELTRTEAEA